MKILLNMLIWVILLVIAIIDFMGLPTFLIFLILKLTGKIAWDWFIVCLPALMSIVAWVLTKVIIAIAETVKEEL